MSALLTCPYCGFETSRDFDERANKAPYPMPEILICGDEDGDQGCFRYFAADITGATSKLATNKGDDAEDSAVAGIFRSKHKFNRTVTASSGEEVIFYIEQDAYQRNRYRLIAITPYIRSDSFGLIFVTGLLPKEAALAALANVGEQEADAAILQAREDGRDAA